MPILNPHSFELISRSAEQTRRVGMRLGSLLQISDTIGLVGELGSGKTTLVQGIASGWGSLDPVSSPTFVLVNVYRHADGGRLFHLDAFRLNGIEEAIDLDIDAMLNQGALVVEWADKIEPALANEGLWVHMKYIDEEQRDMIFAATGKRFEEMIIRLRKLIYGG
jgi:tRNA threonylcarbamoyladenosine biosynthesis protein TsaE